MHTGIFSTYCMITQPLTVLANGTRTLISVPSASSLHSNSVSLSVRGIASQLLFQLSQPVGLVLEVSQTLDKVFNQSVILSVIQSVISSASQSIT